MKIKWIKLALFSSIFSSIPLFSGIENEPPTKKQKTTLTKQQQSALNKQLFVTVASDNIKETIQTIKNGGLLSTTDDSGLTPIFYASTINMMECLQSNGEDIFASKTDSIVKKYTLLHNAAQNNYRKIMNYLLDQGFDPNIPDSIGQTPLMYAAVAENVKAVENLIKRGAKIDICKKGDTTLTDSIENDTNEGEILGENLKKTQKCIKNPLILPNKNMTVKLFFFRIAYHNSNIYYPELNKAYNLFEQTLPKEKFESFLNNLEFMSCNKKEKNRLRKSGFPLTKQELTMKQNLIEFQAKNKFRLSDIIFEL